MDLATVIAGALKGTGFGFSKYSGQELKVADDGNCVEIFAWDVETYRAAAYLFIGTCVEVTLYWAKICRTDKLEINTEGFPQPQIPTWQRVSYRKKEMDDCDFDDADEVEHDDLASMFRSKLGKVFPDK